MTFAVQQNVDLQKLNSLSTPTHAQHYCRVRNDSDLEAALDYAQRHELAITVLGEGSNVVLGKQLPGLVLHQCSHGCEPLESGDDHVSIAVAGGENWHNFVHWCLQQGYFGLENLALIPGSVGAAPIQNIGAYGVEVKEFISTVLCIELETGKRHAFSAEQCEFAYRDSIFKTELRDQMLVQQVIFRLHRQAKPVLDYPSLAEQLAAQGVTDASPHQVFGAVVSIRSSKLPDPRQVPNAGSFFKNPVLDSAALAKLLVEYPDLPHYSHDDTHYKIAAAWLIEHCGFKQQDDAPVRVHPQHALVIINPRHCDAVALRQFAAEIAAAVETRFGLRLEQEPRNYG